MARCIIVRSVPLRLAIEGVKRGRFSRQAGFIPVSVPISKGDIWWQFLPNMVTLSRRARQAGKQAGMVYV